jgi:hypothetical protein
MDGRVFATIAALCLLVAGILAWQQFNQQETKKADLRELRTMLASAESRLERKRNDAAAVQERYVTSQAFLDLEQEKKGLTAEIAQIEAAKADARRKLAEAVRAVQAAAEGIDWTDITLPNGQVITAVKIQKIAPDQVTFAHSGGVVRVNSKDLPDDLKERLGYNFNIE